jgi:hypothetical protein
MYLFEETMMFRQKFLLFSVLLAVSGFTFISCATKAIGVRQDSSFKKEAIVKGKMAVGGVVSAKPISDEEIMRYATSLMDQLNEVRKDYSVSPSGVVADKIGSDVHKSMLAEYKEKGVLGDESLKKLAAGAGGIRYIVFARIDVDAIEKSMRDNSKKDKDGKVVSRSVTATVSRKISVSYNVYDTGRGISAWSGTMETTKKNSREHSADSGLTAAINVAKSIKSGKDKFTYPDPPDINKLLAKNFKGFAKQMPK